MRLIARFVFAAVILFVVSVTAHAGPLHWTAVGTSAAVEPATVGYAGFANGGLSYLNGSSSTGPVQGYWNVTNTTGTETPAWTTLEVGYSQPTNSTVQILFFSVDPCTGRRTGICNFVTGVTSGPTCKTCTFPSNTFDFATNLYVIEANLNRTTPQANPIVYTLRIY